MPSTRRDFLATSGAAGLLQAAPAKARPNILFIMVDEMRWDAMRCVGHPVVQTPNLDRLARQSTLFSNAYTVSPVCCPARVSVFTGRYPHVHGVTTNGLPAHDGEVYLPTILKHHGYDTAIAGKLHYEPKRFSYGFDKFWTFTNEGPTPELGYGAYLQKKHGSPAKFPIVPGTCPWPDDPLGRDVGVFRYPTEDFETEWITERSLEYLRTRKDSTKPWFLFTSYLKPHSPSVEPRPYMEMYDPKAIPVPKLPQNISEIRASQPPRGRRRFIEDEQMMRVMSSAYYGAITHVDRQVGRILDELDRSGFADNTVVLFTADHGNMLGDRGRWFKDVMYEGSSHVPLIWRNPKGIASQPAGTTLAHIVENTDLMPSLLQAAGIAVPEGVQGRSILPLLAKPSTAWKNQCFSELHQDMMVMPGWKLIDFGKGNLELYNLKADAREVLNLASDAKHSDRLRHMRDTMADLKTSRPSAVRVVGMPAPEYTSISRIERESLIANSPAVRERAKLPAR